MKYDIPCRNNGPDYHPLSVDEIVELLKIVQRLKQSDEYIREIASIHMRLCQGIVGMESPRKIDGPVCAADVSISCLYVDFVREVAVAPFDTPRVLAQKMYRVMQLEEK